MGKRLFPPGPCAGLRSNFFLGDYLDLGPTFFRVKSNGNPPARGGRISGPIVIALFGAKKLEFTKSTKRKEKTKKTKRKRKEREGGGREKKGGGFLESLHFF